jgi:polyisoprenoid-binding protein YceI
MIASLYHKIIITNKMKTMENTESKTTTWSIDPSHSKVSFKIKHLMIANVFGNFREFKGQITTKGNDFTTSEISFAIKSSSIDTEASDRDTHLKSPDFFDTDKYPEIVFAGKGLKDLGDDMFELTGNLTIKAVTRPVTLSLEYGGIMKDPWGNIKTGFSVSGKINRKDWNLSWNAALEAGGVLVSDEVKILCDVEFVKIAA